MRRCAQSPISEVRPPLSSVPNDKRERVRNNRKATWLDIASRCGYTEWHVFGAAATALGNLVKAADDIARAIERGQTIEGLPVLVVIVGDKMGVWDKVRIVSLD